MDDVLNFLYKNILLKGIVMSYQKVKELYVSTEKANHKNFVDQKVWNLTERQLCDLEMLLNGGFSPLEGFLSQKDYDSVCENMRLSTGELWAMPITLDVTEAFAKNIKINEVIALLDKEGLPLATIMVDSIWQPNKDKEAEQVFGKNDRAHPAVNYLHHQANDYYIGGKVEGLNARKHYDYTHHRHTPNELRAYFAKNGWEKIIAFQTRNPMHRAHYEMTHRALQSENAKLLLHPVVGMTKPGDVDHHTRVRCYEKIIDKYPEGSAHLSLLPIAMRMGGPREALWHAQIRKNYGATHFIIGRDHAGPGNDSEGNPFYGQYDAQDLVEKHADEIGINIVPFKAVVYVENEDAYKPVDEITEKDNVLNISGTEFRKMLNSDATIPSWFSFSDVIAELKKSYPSKTDQGFCVFFTGLSGAGKSTLANALQIKLMERMSRPVTLLDGDLVRKNLSSELGFSKEHRDLNITRIGYVASEIVKHRGVAICAPIAPYQYTRDAVRSMIAPNGGFIEIHVSTSLETCEARDPKGLYKKARAGVIKGFTGIDDPYETPKSPELSIDTTKMSVDAAVDYIILTLEGFGYLTKLTSQPRKDKQEVARELVG